MLDPSLLGRKCTSTYNRSSATYTKKCGPSFAFRPRCPRSKKKHYPPRTESRPGYPPPPPPMDQALHPCRAVLVVEETLSPAIHGQACLPPPPPPSVKRRNFNSREGTPNISSLAGRSKYILCKTPPLVRNDVKLVAPFWAAKNPIVKTFGSFLGFLPPTLPKSFESTSLARNGI